MSGGDGGPAKREAGRTQIKEIPITAAANAGLTTLATITEQPCLIKSIVIRSNGATTADLTTAAVKGGASQAVTFINALDILQADIATEDDQVGWDGAVSLPATKTVVIDLQGTGATAVDLTATIEYVAVIDGGYLA